jgi:hypothetical protein
MLLICCEFVRTFIFLCLVIYNLYCIINIFYQFEWMKLVYLVKKTLTFILITYNIILMYTLDIICPCKFFTLEKMHEI